MRLLLTAKLLIEADALERLDAGALERIDATARVAFGTFVRPRFDGGISLRTRTTVDPADSDGESDHEFPISERDWLRAEHRYTGSLEQARELHDHRGPIPTAAEQANAPAPRILITATLPIETQSAAAAVGEIKPTDDGVRLMFYRSLQPLIGADASLTTLLTLDPSDSDADAEFRQRGWGKRVSRLSISAHTLRDR